MSNKKADSSLVSILKKSFEQLEQENKHFKEANANLHRQLDEESKLWSELKKENKALKQENKELHSEMERIGKEARKLAFLVDKLKHAIEAEERKA
jgi:chromosome segregation ATPase